MVGEGRFGLIVADPMHYVKWCRNRRIDPMRGRQYLCLNVNHPHSWLGVQCEWFLVIEEDFIRRMGHTGEMNEVIQCLKRLGAIHLSGNIE
jgi:hypothetical protein